MSTLTQAAYPWAPNSPEYVLYMYICIYLSTYVFMCLSVLYVDYLAEPVYLPAAGNLLSQKTGLHRWKTVATLWQLATRLGSDPCMVLSRGWGSGIYGLQSDPKKVHVAISCVYLYMEGIDLGLSGVDIPRLWHCCVRLHYISLLGWFWVHGISRAMVKILYRQPHPQNKSLLT